MINEAFTLLLRPYTMVSAKAEAYIIQDSMPCEMRWPTQLIMLSSSGCGYSNTLITVRFSALSFVIPQLHK